MSKLMKRIPPASSEIPPKDDILVDRVARCNHKAYDGKYDLVELEDCIRGMEKILTVVGVLDEIKLNLRACYLIR